MKDKSLIDFMSEVPDPRINRTRLHDLVDILTIGICCIICGGESFYDMENFGNEKKEWLNKFLPLKNGIPSHDTFNNVFSAIFPKAFIDSFVRWTRTVCQNLGDEIIAIDGKALRRAKNDGEALTYDR